MKGSKYEEKIPNIAKQQQFNGERKHKISSVSCKLDGVFAKSVADLRN